jgi:hypothetical protein
LKTDEERLRKEPSKGSASHVLNPYLLNEQNDMIAFSSFLC